MISQYLDFVTGIKHNARRSKPKPSTPKYDNALDFADRLILWYNRKANLIITKAFTRIQFSRRVKAEKLQLLEQYILRREETAFLQIKKYAHLTDAKERLNETDRFSFPLVVISKVYHGAKTRCLLEGMERLIKTKPFFEALQRSLWKIDQTCYVYHKRVFLPQLFSIYRATAAKDNVYSRHAGYLWKAINKHQISILYQAFNHLVSKISIKDLSELEKSKYSKKGTVHKSGQKRIQQLGQLRRKIYQMKGQIDESRIELYKKKSDGSRSYGVSNIRKAEQFRNMEIATSKLIVQIDKLGQEVTRKQNSLDFRPKTQITFQKLQQIYVSLSKVQNLKQQQKWISTMIPRKHLSDFVKEKNFEVRDNLQLNQLVIVYERSQPVKKLDGYLNAESENSSLKLLVGSLIRMKLLQVKRNQVLASAEDIVHNVRKLKQQTSKLRLQHRLQNKL